MKPETDFAQTRWRLFELLRQENLSARVVDRLAAQPAAAYSQGCERIRKLAKKSWRPPRDLAIEPELASETRRHDKFLRAIRSGRWRFHVRHL